MSHLSDLIHQAKRENPQLGAQIEKEVRYLQERRAFGLNFERHRPEAVDLYGRPVRRGDKVRMLPPRGETTASDTRLWIVIGAKHVDGVRTALLKDRRTDETAEYPIDDLVVVAESHDTIYPGLVSTGKVERGRDKPYHTVINAENLHALKALLYTHRGKVDAIYIDPPYNTGNDSWIYSDRYVANDDAFRHSKWLAFMERRLLLAKDLLAETGIIIVAIGDDEHHHLRMLLDQTFGAENFISNIAWQGSGKNDARYTAGGLDYMIVYARSEWRLRELDTRWKEPKPGIEQAQEAASHAWEMSAGDRIEATKLYRVALRKMKGTLEPAVFRYDQIDNQGRPFQSHDLTSPNLRVNLKYEVVHPITGRAVPTPVNGWRYAREVMARLIDEDRIIFGPDESTTPRFKRFLSEQDDRVPYPSFNQPRMPGSKRLEGILRDRRFPNPKDSQVISRWIGIVAPRDGIILDFFGGSGTTAEAVMRLNDEDGGTRQCIFVSNNELPAQEATRLRKKGQRPGDPEWEERGVARYVAEPRIRTVATGTRSDGSKYSEGLTANVEFFTLTYEAPLNVATNHAFERIAPLLWLRAGSRGRRIEKLVDGWDVAETYGVIADLDRLAHFLDALVDKSDVKIAFVVTDDERQFTSVCSALPDHVEPVRLCESYLRNFQIDAARSSR